MQKKIILFVILSVLLVLGLYGNCFAWSVDDFISFNEQLASDSSTPNNIKQKAILVTQKQDIIKRDLGNYTNFVVWYLQGDLNFYVTNNTINNSRINGTDTIQFDRMSWVDCWLSSRGTSVTVRGNINVTYLAASQNYGLIETSSLDGLLPSNFYFQNKYEQGFTFEPIGVNQVNYNGYENLLAKKIDGNLITLGKLSIPSEKYNYYRFKLLDSNANVVGWLNYNTENDYYSSNNIDAFLNPLTIYIQRRLIYLKEVYTLVIYASDEPFNNDDTNFDDSEVLTYIFLPKNASISGGTITDTGSGDNYTSQDSTNDIIDKINNMENDITNTITDGSQVDNIMYEFLGSGDSSGDIENIAGSLGFTAFDNPFTSFLFFVLDGVYDVLTEREDITLNTVYKSLEFDLSSSYFITPQSELKTFIRNMLICVYIYGNYKYFHYMITLLETARINKFMAEIGTDEFYDTDIM